MTVRIDHPFRRELDFAVRLQSVMTTGKQHKRKPTSHRAIPYFKLLGLPVPGELTRLLGLQKQHAVGSILNYPSISCPSSVLMSELFDGAAGDEA